MKPWASLAVALLAAGCLGTGGGTDGPLVPKIDIRAMDDSRARWAFSANGSTGPIVDYWWNLGEDTEPHGAWAAKKFKLVDATYNITLTVADRHGNRAVAIRALQVGEFRNSAPEPSFARVSRWVAPGVPLIMDSAGTHDGDQDPITLEWYVSEWPAPQGSFAPLTLAPGATAHVTAGSTGLYWLTCRDHHEKAALLVQPGHPATAAMNATNFRLRPDQAHVAPGGDLVFTNNDPLTHNLTLEGYVPGQPAGTERSLPLTSKPAGDYQVWITVQDAKGGRTALAQGVKISQDAPRVNWQNVTGARRTYLDDPVTFPIGRIDFRTITWARLDFEALPLETAVHLRLVDDKGLQQTDKICAPPGPCELATVLYEGTYGWQLDVDEGAIDSFALGSHFQMFAEPPFGAGSVNMVSAGHDHEH